MARFAQFVDGGHALRTRSGDNRDLVFLSGTAGLFFQGTGGSFIRDTLLVPFGPRWQRVDDVAPVASLASLFNVNVATNAGWAADNANWGVLNNQILLFIAIAVSDSDGQLLRVSFQASALGVLA